MKPTARAVVGMVVLAGALSGCASGTPSSSDVQTAPTNVVATTTPNPVPKPAGKTVLRMDGALTRHNVGKAVTFDLLTRAGVAPTAERVYLHALADYKVDFKVSDLMAPRVLLATKADGAPIPLGKGGPTQLVFPPDAPAGKNKDRWIWSIDSMTIR
jgi:hypothetical protein